MEKYLPEGAFILVSLIVYIYLTIINPSIMTPVLLFGTVGVYMSYHLYKRLNEKK